MATWTKINIRFLYVEMFTRFLYVKPAKKAALGGRAAFVKKTILFSDKYPQTKEKIAQSKPVHALQPAPSLSRA
tara:strand:+ start:2899 stop:3120 length:222 start_codon:yes stop_codon:yes gene_type:complete